MPVIPSIGDVFSGCQILAKCGSGAYGITFLARNPLGQQVIIKIVGDLNGGERELAGLRNYMLVAGKHPNLLQIYHIGEHEDGFYYTMEAADNIGSDSEYIPATLGNFFRQQKRFTPDEAVKIIRELAAGLQVMHNAGLIHRDIKPDNIIFVNGKPKLSDPGLVITLGENASFAGTPGFIPPELLTGCGVVDHKADIYALGKVFYCLVTGLPAKRYPELPVNLRIDVCRQLYPVLTRMCNSKPEKRFKSVEEMLQNLPLTLKDPNCFERWYEDFRGWKQLYVRKYRIIKYTLLGVFALALLGMGAFYIRQYQIRSHAEKIRTAIKKFRKINQQRRDLELLQFKVYLPEKTNQYTRLQVKLHKAEKSRDPRLAFKAMKELESFLTHCAAELVPKLPENASSTAAGEQAVGAMYGFLASPLAEYLPGDKKAALRSALDKFKKKLYDNWNGLRCGRDLDNMQYYFMPLKFLPPGAVFMPHTGKSVKIPYHFWIGKHEVISEDLERKIGIAPQMGVGGSNPVERISWNDVLFYCWKLTNLLKEQNILPENYIVRPPTEAEWQFAADNGWLGKDDTPLVERASIAVNSQKRTWPARRMKPNKLGIYDIYGNVAEIVQPIEPTAMQNSVIVRGGSFTGSEKDCYKRIEFLKYQNIPYNIGFRIAVAPGSMDYFDREFFLGGAVQANLRGKVYELLGANVGSFNWHRAKDLCTLLGGVLAEVEDAKHLAELRKALPLTGKWETFLGGTRVDGKWLWDSSRRPVNFGKWRKAKRQNDEKHLTLVGNSWDRTKHRSSGILLCQWSEKSYDQRNRQLVSGKKLPFELCRFDYKGKRYILFGLNGHWLTAKRVCELLGGTLAMADREDIKNVFIKKLAPYRNHRIWLGGYCKRDNWYWLNGKETATPKEDPSKRSIPTANLNYISLHNDTLYNSPAQSGCMFLCEWRLNSASSH